MCYIPVIKDYNHCLRRTVQVLAPSGYYPVSHKRPTTNQPTNSPICTARTTCLLFIFPGSAKMQLNIPCWQVNCDLHAHVTGLVVRCKTSYPTPRDLRSALPLLRCSTIMTIHAQFITFIRSLRIMIATASFTRLLLIPSLNRPVPFRSIDSRLQS